MTLCRESQTNGWQCDFLPMDHSACPGVNDIYFFAIGAHVNSVQFIYLFMLETYIHANNYKNAKETCKRLMISRYHAGHPSIK